MKEHVTTTHQEKNIAMFAYLGTFMRYAFLLAPFLALNMSLIR